MREGVVRTAITGGGTGAGERGMAAGAGVGAVSMTEMANGGTAGVADCSMSWMPDEDGEVGAIVAGTRAGNFGGRGFSGFAAINPDTAVSGGP
jgi:hypothetical protein